MLRETAGPRIGALILAACLAGAPLAAPAAFAATGEAEKSQDYLIDAERHLEAGDANAAVIQLKNALQADANNLDARRILGKVYLRVGNGPYAEKEFHVVIRRGGGDTEVRMMLAEAYLLQGKYSEVLTDLEDNISEPGVRSKVLLLRGRAYTGLHRFDQAQAAFTEADRLAPGGVGARIGLARVDLIQGKTEDAERMIDEVLAINPDSADALVMKAELRRLSRDLEAAIEYFGKAITASPRSVPARLGRAASLVDLNRNDEARADVEAVFATVSRHPLASYLMALILAKKGDFVAARDALQQGGAVLQNHMPSVFLAGAISYSLNQLEQAVHNLTRYTEAVPQNIAAVKLLAAALVRSHEPEKVIKLLAPHVEKDTKDPQILALAASAYMRVGNHTRGAELFEKAAALAPDAATIRTQLALSRLALGQADRAVGDLETAIDLDPGESRASVLLTLVQLRGGKYDEALVSADALHEKMPGTPLPDNLMGAAWLGKGDLAKAREAFERALEIDPDFHPARMNVAQIDLRSKKVDAAIANLKEIVRRNKRHVGAMLALASIARSQGRVEESFTWLRQAADAAPGAVTPQLKLIEYQSRQGELQKALSVARDLEQAHPRDARVLEALGRTEMMAKEHLAAVVTLRRLVELLPSSAPAYNLLASAQQAVRDFDAARVSLEKAISLDDNFIAAHLALVALEIKADRPDAAMKIARAMIDKRPDSAFGHMLAGDIHVHQGDFDQAIAEYDAGLAKEDIAMLAVRRFNAERRRGDVAEAFAYLQGWVDRNKDRSIRHYLATAYISAERYDDAIRESERLLTDEQNNPILLNNLAWLYDQKNDHRAVAFGERALKNAPGTPAIMDTLGWILVGRGEVERGAELLAKASKLAPTAGDIAYHHAVALQKTGHADEARRKLRKLVGSGLRFKEFGNAETLLKQLGG